jgi:uncharacterized protein (DUF2235 family)
MTYKPRNLVVCLDGTGNQIEENISNVLKLYRALDKSTSNDGQIAFYDQGVGTIGQLNTWGVLSQKAATVWGLATGHGLDRNVLRAYDFLARNYREGKVTGTDVEETLERDRIFIFGYSRGAHTARVLAAFLYNIGLLRPEQLNLAGAALTAYKRANEKRGVSEIDEFRRITQTPIIAIDFIGAWDTVSSMIVPRPDRFLVPTIEKLRNTRTNPGVHVFRHAMAIDEARYMFRLDHWDEGQTFKPNTHSTGDREEQDCEQVWFAGYHGDVGGGNARASSGASQFSLCWMIREAMLHGLKFNPRMVDYVAGRTPYTATTAYLYPAADSQAKLHSSKRSAWTLLEYLPKLSRFRELEGKSRRKSVLGLYLPRWEPRTIPEGAKIHASAIERKESVPDYRPKNFPVRYIQVPHDSRPAREWTTPL